MQWAELWFDMDNITTNSLSYDVYKKYSVNKPLNQIFCTVKKSTVTRVAASYLYSHPLKSKIGWGAVYTVEKFIFTHIDQNIYWRWIISNGEQSSMIRAKMLADNSKVCYLWRNHHPYLVHTAALSLAGKREWKKISNCRTVLSSRPAPVNTPDDDDPYFTLNSGRTRHAYIYWFFKSTS